MQKYAETLISKRYPAKDLTMIDCGGGFYGRVFLAKSSSFQIIVKMYLKDGISIREKLQLEELRKYALLKVPRVFHIHTADETVPYDALLMEYIEGQNAGTVNVHDIDKEQVANGIIDNLISIHNYIHKEGFGEIGSDQFVSDWRIFYKPIARKILQKAEHLYSAQLIDLNCITIMRNAYEQFDSIFAYPITDASLIHGDYNTLNLLLNPDCSKAIGMIDPYNCCYGDREYDLYQLNHVNGLELNLLDLYQSKCSLSPNWHEKMAFYELFTELMHYYDSGVTPDLLYLKPKIDQLESVIHQ